MTTPSQGNCIIRWEQIQRSDICEQQIFYWKYTHADTDRRTDRLTNRRTDGRTDRQTDKRTDRQTHKHSCLHFDQLIINLLLSISEMNNYGRQKISSEKAIAAFLQKKKNSKISNQPTRAFNSTTYSMKARKSYLDVAEWITIKLW